MFDFYILLALLCSVAGLLGMYLLRWRDCLDASGAIQQQAKTAPSAGISVVVPVKHLSPQTEACVAELMKQEYSDFEVIVIEENPQKDSKDERERLQRTFPGLRHSAVPASSRYIDRRKMALTLGFRAAHKPWVVMADAESVPASTQWLNAFAQQFDDGVRIVTAYANYADDGSRRARRAICERLLRQLHACRGTAHGTPFATEDSNVAVRKDFFLACGGFQHSLSLPFGSVQLFVSTYGTPENTRCILSPEATVLQALPHAAELRNRRIENTETKRHCPARTKRYALRNAAASFSTYLLVLATAAHLVLRALGCLENFEAIKNGAETLVAIYPAILLAYDIPLLLLIAAALLMPYLLLRKVTDALGERRFGALTLLWYALASPFRTLSRHLVCLRLRRYWTRPTHAAPVE